MIAIIHTVGNNGNGVADHIRRVCESDEIRYVNMMGDDAWLEATPATHRGGITRLHAEFKRQSTWRGLSLYKGPADMPDALKAIWRRLNGVAWKSAALASTHKVSVCTASTDDHRWMYSDRHKQMWRVMDTWLDPILSPYPVHLPWEAWTPIEAQDSMFLTMYNTHVTPPVSTG